MPYIDYIVPAEIKLDIEGLPKLHRTLADILGVSVDKMKANFIRAEQSVVGDQLDGAPVLEARMQVMAGRPDDVLGKARDELLSFIRGAVRRADPQESPISIPASPDTLVVEVSFVHVVQAAHGKETLRFDQLGSRRN